MKPGAALQALQLYGAATLKRLEIFSLFSYKIVIKNYLNSEGHINPINGSKVMAILLKRRILPIDGASAVEGLRSTGLPHLVFLQLRLIDPFAFVFFFKLILHQLFQTDISGQVERDSFSSLALF